MEFNVLRRDRVSSLPQLTRFTNWPTFLCCSKRSCNEGALFICVGCPEPQPLFCQAHKAICEHKGELARGLPHWTTDQFGYKKPTPEQDILNSNKTRLWADFKLPQRSTDPPTTALTTTTA
jgi:hypothetical protein